MAEELHVAAPLRGFGLGMGAQHQITITRDGPTTGALLMEEECAAVAAWAEAPTQSISDIVPPERLAGALRNRLQHGDFVELVRLLPKALAHLSPEMRGLLVSHIRAVPEEMWSELSNTRPDLCAAKFDKLAPTKYFMPLAEEGEGAKVAPGNNDIFFNGVSMEALASVMPILFEALTPPQQIAMTDAIARALHEAGADRDYFAPLADPNLNRLVVASDPKGACSDIINNGRTFMIRSANGPVLGFQGNTFSSSNLHFHPLAGPGGERPRDLNGNEDATAEFLTYDNAKQAAFYKGHPSDDPNRALKGQLHFIARAQDGRAILLGADVVMGEENPEIGKYLAKVKQARGPKPLEIIPNLEDKEDVTKKAVPAADIAFDPLAAFAASTDFTQDGLHEAPFFSLHLGGLRVNSLDDVQIDPSRSQTFGRVVQVIQGAPITVSPGQLAELRRYQPVLQRVDEETCVHPLARALAPNMRVMEKGRGFTGPGA